jgi:nucleotide-binding universal stress UspA family protein
VSDDDPPAPERLRRVLVGYDGSAASTRAIRFALGLLDGSPGEVWLVHATHAPRAVAEPRTEEELRSEPHAIESTLRSISAASDPSGHRVHFLLRDGAPAAVLLAAAREVDADLIVVGTRGLRGAARLMLGSVSEAVIAEAHRPVAIVP